MYKPQNLHKLNVPIEPVFRLGAGQHQQHQNAMPLELLTHCVSRAGLTLSARGSHAGAATPDLTFNSGL